MAEPMDIACASAPLAAALFRDDTPKLPPSSLARLFNALKNAFASLTKQAMVKLKIPPLQFFINCR
jgi:hypothetical protein